MILALNSYAVNQIPGRRTEQRLVPIKQLVFVMAPARTWAPRAEVALACVTPMGLLVMSYGFSLNPKCSSLPFTWGKMGLLEVRVETVPFRAS